MNQSKGRTWKKISLSLLVAVLLLTGCKNQDDSVKERAGTPINLSGMNTDLYRVKEAVALDEGGYAVTVEAAGFESTIEAVVYFDDTADQVTGLEILSQGETEGLGSRITEPEFLAIFSGFRAPVTVTESNMQIVDPVVSAEIESKKQEALSAGFVDGTYTANSAEFSSGYKGTASITIQGGKIVAASYDSVSEDGSKKTEMSKNGEYILTEDGLRWHEQAEEIANYIIANQSTEIPTDDAGKTDVIAGVSISVTEAKNLFADCLTQATAGAVKDGTYEVEADEFSNGYKGIAQLTIQGGKITEVLIDSINEEGKKKSELSKNGEYVMTEDGLLWYEQADRIAAYVIENQTVSIPTDDAGKTDAIAGVSISVSDVDKLLAECYSQAKEAEEKEEEEIPTINGTAFDAVTGATKTSEGVARAINNAYFFLKNCIVK